MRVYFNEGQEIVRDDFNKISSSRQREFYDRILYEILQRTTDGFFEGSCLVSYVDPTTVSVAAGLGIQDDLSQVSPEPTKRPIYVAEDAELEISESHATLDRIDIVSIKSALVTTLTESRRYKATVESVVTNQTFDTEKDWEADIVITEGTPDSSPVAPSTPSGYIKIATLAVTAVTGLSGSGAVTDNRMLLALGPTLKIDTSNFVSVPTQATDTKLSTVLSELDARSGAAYASYISIVGSESFCTHSSLYEALTDADVLAGSRILVLENETIDSGNLPTVDKNNILIDFSPGATFTAGTSATGLVIDASGVRIRGGRFSGFDDGIIINDTKNNNFITECRFSSCTNDVTDNNSTPNNVVIGNLTE